MNCMEREQLFAYVHRMLEGREEETVRGHLEECAHCRGAVAELHKLDAVLDEWKPREPSAWFDARVKATIAAAERQKAVQGFLAWPWARAIAAAVALLALIVAGLLVFRTREPIETTRPLAQKEQPAVQQPAETPKAPGQTVAQSQPAATQPGQAPSVEDEITMYENLGILEDYELLAGFDVLSELPMGEKKVAN
ncbi:MAG TPA: zf-HC2 domain-containing protein [Terriglobia bacterium]|nr:zf-HC2 domain-containing protein [Terriglobia bacterium]